MLMTMDKEEAKAKVSDLVGGFFSYDRQGKLAGMSEEDTKRAFIEPLFEALGWDVHNPEEVWENRSQAGGKRPDYAFRIDGVVRFFLEAKEAHAELSEPEAWQAINYSYNNSVPWALLTNFRELAIYNANWKAKGSEDSRFLRIEVSDYIGSFDDLWLLSKEGMVSGEMEKKAQRYGRLAREPVTKALYSDLMRWRSMISKSVSKNDPRKKFTKELLDEAVQRFLNRLIFIRTCEDRKIENEQLRAALRQWEGKNNRKLRSYVQEIVSEGFVDTYDSDIFFPHMAGELPVEDDVMAQVLDELYESPSGAQYNFDAINADVLGNIYEQYLATVMREGGSLVERDGKRKEMGIYYTPTYIVDYIVKNTLGELVSKAKTADDLRKITVLDPACGSGSFLIRAFETLREEYAKKNGGDHQMLSENVSKNAHDILTRNIHGVDLDMKAIEIAELNLLLRAATRRGLLPPLSDNIKRGNSLISGTKEEMEGHFGPHWKEKHPFNWETEFKEVMDGGGFDVVVGNPPYVRFDNLNEEERKFLFENYQTAVQKCDIYSFFIERGVSNLKDGASLGFIVSSSWLSQHSFNKLRRFILDTCAVKQIITTPSDTFEDAAVRTVIIILEKTKSASKKENNNVLTGTIDEKGRISNAKRIPQKIYSQHDDNLFVLEWDGEIQKLEQKLVENCKLLDDAAELSFGIMTGDDSKFTYSEKQHPKEDKKVLRGGNVKRYNIVWTGEYVWYDPEMMKKHKETARPGEPARFEAEKIVIKREGAGMITACLDREKYYSIGSTFIVNKKDVEFGLAYLLGLLNSKLINWWYGRRYRTVTQSINSYQKIPIHLASSSEQQPIVKLVEDMLDLNRKLVGMGAIQSSERHGVEEEIKRTDAQIDELVYRLYGIAEEEKKVIEESFAKN